MTELSTAVDDEAVAIGELYERGRSSFIDAVQARLQCGRRLKAKREALPHGEWLPWLKANADVLGFDNDSTARRLMSAANRAPAHDLAEPEAAKISRRMWGHDKAAEKKQRRVERKREIEARAADVPPATERYSLHNEPCANVCNMDAESVDWVITDPPYPQEYLNVYDDLASAAAHVLKPGGSLLCMIGQSYLPDIVAKLSAHLTYHWTLAYLTPGGQATQIFPRKINTFWKPVLWFVRDEYQGDWLGDVTRSKVNDNDKRFHHWGQSESGMADLMTRFVKPGDRVLDPFMGAGTTGIITLELDANFVGFDTDTDAFNEAAVRLNDVAAKLVR